MATRSYNQLCGLAYALDIVGERWTLLIIRELMPGPRRFTDLMEGLPGISSNLLSGRLKDLEKKGLIRRRDLPPPAASTVYELTPLGKSLEPMLLELGKWGSQFVPETPGGDALLHLGSYALTLKTFFDHNETFLYEYNYYDAWQLKIRVEAKVPFNPDSSYPYCTGGNRAAPAEDCGGAWRFMELKHHYSPYFILDRLQTILSDPDLEETRWDYADEFKQLRYWIDVDRFDRRLTNQKLQEHFYAQMEENDQ